jgi:hypothetical protein
MHDLERSARCLGKEQYLRKVPLVYHQTSGLAAYDFKILAPRGPCKHARTTHGEVIQIDPCAYCIVRVEGQLIEVLVSMAAFPDLYEAISLFGQFQTSTSARFEKYMKVFKAYESLSGKPSVEYSAIRHGISHSESALDRPKTLRALTQLFGSAKIDLSKERHRKQFWSRLASLLILTDSLLYETILKNLNNYRKRNELEVY